MESKVIKRETLTKENEFKIEKDDLKRKVKRKKSNSETLEEDLKKIKDSTKSEKKDQTIKIPKKKETKKPEQEDFLIDQNVKMEQDKSPKDEMEEERKVEPRLNFKIPKIKRENQNDSQGTPTPPPPSKQHTSPLSSSSSIQRKNSPDYKRNRSKSPEYKRQRNYSPHSSDSPKYRQRKRSSTPERSRTPERPRYSGYRRKDYREQRESSRSPRHFRRRRNYSHSPSNTSYEKKKETTSEIDTKEKWREHIKKIKENCQTTSSEEMYGPFSSFIFQYGSFLKPYSQDPTNFLIEEVYTKEIYTPMKLNSPKVVSLPPPPPPVQKLETEEKKELKKKMYEMISEFSGKYFDNFPKEELKLMCKKLTQKIAEKETMESYEKVETQKKIKAYVEKYLEEKIKK
jgi:hypothetical protein